MIYISRIIKNFVGAFDKMENIRNFLFYIHITWAKTLHFKDLWLIQCCEHALFRIS